MEFLDRLKDKAAFVTDRLKDEAAFLTGILRALKMTTHIAKHPTRVFPDVIEELAQRHGDRPALLSERELFSYRLLAERSNRYARWAIGQRVGRGDVVCLLMPNRPEYMAIWLGITRAGGVAALLNTNLVGRSLAHCIDIVAPKHVIVAAELLDVFATTRPLLKTAPSIWLHGGEVSQHTRIERHVEGLSGGPLSAAERPPLTIEDRALYIYTSGTTGLPKAANVNHYRVMLACFGFAGVMATKATDRMYNCLPMYHTAGGLCATGSLLINGGSVILREKFSAREFWNDVVRHECTLFQYIGELCRYLVNSPPDANETGHRLRLACGNGLRPDVWNEFKQRFRIPQIIEFYAATEGNVLLFNFAGKPGAIGRLPRIIAGRFPTALVQFDVAKGEPVRDATGFCVLAAPHEIGEAIGEIVQDPERPGSRFEGYSSSVENERKILRDVLQRGDIWFRTGDLMTKDEQGYFYFVDRIGDTFRWKGENVSTTEVAETINLMPGVKESNVYGVPIPGNDGRAGMAALVFDGPCDLAALREHLVARLPDYARPLFLRIQKEIDVTATFKQRKMDLVQEGFDPVKVDDPIYFNDPQTGAFVRLDRELHDRILTGQVRL
jgi:fatty-acyl-CoA synthase